MRLVLSLIILTLTISACGPMASNEGKVDRPDDYYGREFYVSPEGVSEAELNRMLPGTRTGPKEFKIRGRQPVFPVKGVNRYRNDWQESREGGKRRHEGNDIMAKKMIPVVAFADGIVQWVNDQSNGKCCSIGIGHADGWQSLYVHLNNDTPGKIPEDNKGNGIASHIKVKSRVKAGEIIGWVGDSGNAESSSSHLHFEFHYKETPVNPYYILKQSKSL